MKPLVWVLLAVGGVAAFGGWVYLMDGNHRIQVRMAQDATERTKQKEADAQYEAQEMRNALVGIMQTGIGIHTPTPVNII